MLATTQVSNTTYCQDVSSRNCMEMHTLTVINSWYDQQFSNWSWCNCSKEWDNLLPEAVL